jgi:hypothetical protein
MTAESDCPELSVPGAVKPQDGSAQPLFPRSISSIFLEKRCKNTSAKVSKTLWTCPGDPLLIDSSKRDGGVGDLLVVMFFEFPVSGTFFL